MLSSLLFHVFLYFCWDEVIVKFHLANEIRSTNARLGTEAMDPVQLID